MCVCEEDAHKSDMKLAIPKYTFVCEKGPLPSIFFVGQLGDFA